MGTTLCIPCCGRLLLVHSLCHIFLPVLIFCIYRISPAEFSVLSNVGGANVSKLLAFLKRSISDSKPCRFVPFWLKILLAISGCIFNTLIVCVFWFWKFQIEGNRFLVLFLLLGWIWKTQICPLQTLQVTNLPVPLVILISSSTLFWYKNNSAWSLAVARKFRKIRTKKSFLSSVYFFISLINSRSGQSHYVRTRSMIGWWWRGTRHDWPTLPIGLFVWCIHATIVNVYT